jgi:hypothetical protein
MCGLGLNDSHCLLAIVDELQADLLCLESNPDINDDEGYGALVDLINRVNIVADHFRLTGR